MLRPYQKNSFSVLFLHPVPTRSGSLEPLVLHPDMEIAMTNFKLVNCAQICPFTLLSSLIFFNSALLFFPLLLYYSSGI